MAWLLLSRKKWLDTSGEMVGEAKDLGRKEKK